MDDIQRYYETHVQDEWERLEQHRTEYAVTLRALADYLPRPPATVLDVGGGPGRYAIELAARGYRVTLLDLSLAAAEFAREKAAERHVEVEAVQGTALDLSRYPDHSFDAVLLLGPLYHLIEAADRLAAAREAWRVLEPGGVVFAAFIGRYASVARDGAKRRPEGILEARAEWEKTLETGVYTPQPGGPFTQVYLVLPTEPRPLLESAGFETLDLIAAEGIVDGIEEGVNALSGEAFDAWADLNYRIGRDPSVHGAASHLLYVGRKGGPALRQP